MAWNGSNQSQNAGSGANPKVSRPTKPSGRRPLHWLALLAVLAAAYYARLTYKETVKASAARKDEASVILDALNAIVDASEATASTVQDAAKEEKEDEE